MITEFFSRILPVGLILLQFALPATAQKKSTGLYRLFEVQLTNNKSYANKFTDVELTASFKSPSGKVTDFFGFFDGDGKGGGSATSGDVWRIRFMPDELGTWSYVYKWSDNTPGGRGTFTCVSAGAGTGPLKAYNENPHWFAYNGTDPVWLKSYYETGHGIIAQDFDWAVKNVYNKFIEQGYNHLQVNWLLSLCCFEQYYLDGPKPATLDLMLYKEGEITTSMKLNVWQMMERHLSFLNEKNIGVHMFLGFDGAKNDGPRWDVLTEKEKDFFVRYVVARIAPFANLAGWNFLWEVDGGRETHELGWARLIKKYDVFNRLITYEDEYPRENEFDRPEYSFASVENHLIAADHKELDRLYWKEPWTHHMAVLLGYKNKPVFMSEGNALWRRFWHERSGATQEDLRRSAWACATGGASFTWNGHEKEYELYAEGPTGLPFNEENPFKASEKYVDILATVMSKEISFSRMVPSDGFLKHHDAMRVWALAEEGKQYLVFSSHGEPFGLAMKKGEYSDNVWIDTKTGNKVNVASVTVSEEMKEPLMFEPPGRDTDWVLIMRTRN